MSLITLNCTRCGKRARKLSGGVNRSRRLGLPLYCGRRCAGLARRKHKTKAQRIEEKRLYDIEYKKRNEAALKVKRAAYFQRTYDPVKAAIERKKRMPRHVEYCRQPWYREWKRQYDAAYSGLKEVLWETLNDVRTEQMLPGRADSVAVAAREILRTVKVQLQISGQAKRPLPREVVDFAER